MCGLLLLQSATCSAGEGMAGQAEHMHVGSSGCCRQPAGKRLKGLQDRQSTCMWAPAAAAARHHMASQARQGEQACAGGAGMR